MSQNIALVSVSLADRRIFMDGGQLGAGSEEAVTLLSTNVDSGSSPTTLLRKGNVFNKASSGKWVEANDATAVHDSVAAVTGSGAAFATGSLTFKWKYRNGVEQTVTGASATDTLAEWVTLLNADRDFAADLIADNSGGELRIRSKRAGPEEYFEITDGTVNTEAGLTDNTEAAGGAGEYGVLLKAVSMLNAAGTAADKHGVAIRRIGHFDESNLVNLTKKARQALIRDGSRFSS